MTTHPNSRQTRGRYARRRTLRGPLAAVVAVLAVLVLLLASCAETGAPDESDAVAAATQSTTVEVLYEVEGTTDWASVTLATPTGTRQFNPDVPMTVKGATEPGLSGTMPRGEFLYISAQNKRGHGTITCRITVDGVVISENSSSGGYAIATCEGVAQ